MIISMPVYAQNTASDKQTSKAASMVCSIDKECSDLVSIQLDGMYYLGLNERDPASIGTLINRKAKTLQTFCEHAEDRKICDTYRNQLMLKYITGLLDR
ncbi:valyl tRNA synthetase modifier [Acinetobacter phage ZZ1]|nr:valyl tRNA synthetase modifier [Acinetobacter phage ZZ1]AHE63451.1 hypothetical protein ZZ1p0140 [Acinetobacter phage ZZ1]